MQILKNDGKFEILATWPSDYTNEHAQEVIELAGRTCYQSIKGPINEITAEAFTSKAVKRTHFSVIEHGWRGYIISSVSLDMSSLLYYFWPVSKFMYFTERRKAFVKANGQFDVDLKSTFLVSANLETWRKLYVEGLLNGYETIKKDLESLAPDVFNPSIIEDSGVGLTVAFEDITPITNVDQLESNEEQLVHIAHTVVYNDHSRGFTHELVRHRPPVYSQESTRYVDESDFKVVVPPHKDENEAVPLLFNGNQYQISVKTWFEMNEQFYRNLRKIGWEPEDARQVLPTAIKAQIVSTCNLLERRYIYFRRTSKPAHWEIRATECQELKVFKELFPDIFEAFIYKEGTDTRDKQGYFEVNDISVFLK